MKILSLVVLFGSIMAVLMFVFLNTIDFGSIKVLALINGVIGIGTISLMYILRPNAFSYSLNIITNIHRFLDILFLSSLSLAVVASILIDDMLFYIILVSIANAIMVFNTCFFQHYRKAIYITGLIILAYLVTTRNYTLLPSIMGVDPWMHAKNIMSINSLSSLPSYWFGEQYYRPFPVFHLLAVILIKTASVNIYRLFMLLGFVYMLVIIVLIYIISKHIFKNYYAALLSAYSALYMYLISRWSLAPIPQFLASIYSLLLLLLFVFHKGSKPLLIIFLMLILTATHAGVALMTLIILTIKELVSLLFTHNMRGIFNLSKEFKKFRKLYIILFLVFITYITYTYIFIFKLKYVLSNILDVFPLPQGYHFLTTYSQGNTVAGALMASLPLTLPIIFSWLVSLTFRQNKIFTLFLTGSSIVTIAIILNVLVPSIVADRYVGLSGYLILILLYGGVILLKQPKIIRITIAVLIMLYFLSSILSGSLIPKFNPLNVRSPYSMYISTPLTYQDVATIKFVVDYYDNDTIVFSDWEVAYALVYNDVLVHYKSTRIGDVLNPDTFKLAFIQSNLIIFRIEVFKFVYDRQLHQLIQNLNDISLIFTSSNDLVFINNIK